MAYSASNPPGKLVERLGGGPAMWVYSSTDAIATIVADADYFTNADDLGMVMGDLLWVVNTTASLSSLGQITTIAADGSTTIVALTAVA